MRLQKKHGIPHRIQKIEKIQALALAKECYSMKLDLLTNATVVDDAVRFVAQGRHLKDKSKEGTYNIKLDCNNNIQAEERQMKGRQKSTINEIF